MRLQAAGEQAWPTTTVKHIIRHGSLAIRSGPTIAHSRLDNGFANPTFGRPCTVALALYASDRSCTRELARTPACLGGSATLCTLSDAQNLTCVSLPSAACQSSSSSTSPPPDAVPKRGNRRRLASESRSTEADVQRSSVQVVEECIRSGIRLIPQQHSRRLQVQPAGRRVGNISAESQTSA